VAALDGRRLERIVSHYPSQGGAIASMLAPSLGVPTDQLVVANGACEVIQALPARWSGPLLLCLPTFSAYYELASGPVVPHRLDPALGFRVDFEKLDALVDRYRPDTVVVINPNNPDGGLAAHEDLVAFVERTHGRLRQLIVDESFGAFTRLQAPRTLAPLVAELRTWSSSTA
jgi:histidinol-phosphate/aromatic aminotransferase/cobyric acid decarboxylase-like protein